MQTWFLWCELTSRCQLSCQHCYARSGPSGTHGTMRSADWVRVLDQATELGVQMVQFIGGEPTLYPDLGLLIDQALRRGALSSNVCTELWSIVQPLYAQHAMLAVLWRLRAAQGVWAEQSTLA
ncbi:MAG: radical SAM protein [Pseudonocardiaceae bacterium]